MRIEIRKADLMDIEWLLSELKKFAEFIGIKKHNLFPEEDFARETLKGFIENQVVLIADSNLGKAGFIAGIYAPHPFNPNLMMLTETFWWVKKEFRRSRCGIQLLDAFVEWGEEHADLITMTLEHNSQVGDRALINRGFRLQERSYLKEV
jgi:hypothetical protein